MTERKYQEDEAAEIIQTAATPDQYTSQPFQHPRFNHLGMPVGVGRWVDLPRAPSDTEWEELVAELRQTFAAQGRVSGLGSNLKSWQNSKLRVYIEPSESGYRLQLRTVKGNALLLNRMGAIMVAVGTSALIVGAVFSRAASELFPTLFMTGVGALALVFNAVRLPGWAKLREQQMDYIANTARELIRDDG
jgi:hypothetical protein